MNSIRLRRKIDSETLHLPELREFMGKEVEIIVQEENGEEQDSEETLRNALQHSILLDEDPFEPVAEEDWEALK